MLSLSTFATLATPRMVALQTPLSMEFSRQEYWSGELRGAWWATVHGVVKSGT